MQFIKFSPNLATINKEIKTNQFKYPQKSIQSIVIVEYMSKFYCGLLKHFLFGTLKRRNTIIFLIFLEVTKYAIH